jgi:hypothetical protein
MPAKAARFGAIMAMNPGRRGEDCLAGASCLDRTDGYLCDIHYEQETRAAEFGGGAGFDDEVDLPW